MLKKIRDAKTINDVKDVLEDYNRLILGDREVDINDRGIYGDIKEIKEYIKKAEMRQYKYGALMLSLGIPIGIIIKWVWAKALVLISYL